MRVTTAFKRLVDLPRVHVIDVDIGTGAVVVTVALRRRRLECPECGHSTRARYDHRPVDSRWRHLDLGVWRLEVRARLRRLRCPTHGVRTEAVPFARPDAEFTGDFEALVAWLATRMDKTAICRLVRINWRTVGRIIERVVADELDPGRLDNLFEIGVDEISWRKHHNYLTLVADHRSGKVVWGAVRPLWQELRQLPDPTIAKKFKGARWALLKNPEDLTDTQATTLTAIRRNGGAMWRAYTLKEALRAIFAGDLTEPDADHLLDRWCSWAQRSRLAPFVKLARTIRAHRDGILAAIRLGLANGRLEGLNTRVRLIVRRAFGFHSAGAALALVMLSCGPITLHLPHERTTVRPHP